MNEIEVTPSAYSYPLLIKQLLHTPLHTAPEQEIVFADRLRLSYRELRQRIGRLASGLEQLGIRPGDTVAVMDWDSHRYLECFFAVPMMGCVLQTVNVRLSPEQVLYTLNHARPKALLIHADFLPELSSIRARLETVETFVLIHDGEEVVAEKDFSAQYEPLVASGDAGFEFPDFSENTRATTFYTTGTTGRPKGVYYSHRQLVLHTLACSAALALPASQGRFHRGDVYMPITPMFHVHAWGNPYAATLAGVKQVYPGRYAPDRLLELFRREGVTFSHCVPTILQMVLDEADRQDVDLSGWKIVVGGSALPAGLARRAMDRGVDVFSGYGMSETGPQLAMAQLRSSELTGQPDEEIAYRTRTGLPVPLVDLRIVDGDMRDVPHDGEQTGEVVVRAPWLTQGYLGDPQASEGLWAGGYLHTGDVARITPDGYLKITDRLKDVIKTGGEWVSSLELEDILSQHPSVKEAAVIGVPDERWGERPLALVVAYEADGLRCSEKELKAHVADFAERGVVSRYAVPDRIQFVDALERTSVGKLDKKRMRVRYCPPTDEVAAE